MGLNSKILIGFVVGIALIAGLEFAFEGGSLLYCMLFFAAISMGPVAIVGAVDIAGSDWIRPYRKMMLSVRHIILLIALLFVVFWLTGKVHLYEWTKTPNAYLNENFFVLRNVLLLFFAWIMANKYAKESLTESDKKAKWAVLWELTYVITQTFVAIDWVMSLEYPWISTLFGAYFFVEAFYSGLAVAALMTFFNHQNFISLYSKEKFAKSQMDMMTMMFGFSIFWAYQFYSQFLVIWYGNIPEEVSFLSHRLDIFSNWLYIVLVILFVIPFVTLLSRKIKANPTAVMIIGSLILAGILIERLFMLVPHMILNPVITPIEFLILGILYIMVIKNEVESPSSSS